MYFSAYKNERCDYLLFEAGDTDITETSKSAITDQRIENVLIRLKITS
jgi:hypothetical protein